MAVNVIAFVYSGWPFVVLYGSECDSLCIFWVSGLRSNLSIDLWRTQGEATPLPLLGFLFRSAE
ncbi:hypothetical protein Pint_16065 [Pistacia integerrima]|uniref:Uncharacterized protein n=1 Tax=Pistacia integerrima TaxID=434235 RepID=A0ACC0ZBG8_9ROSI|nr:hypothetical protein Pint_16065 [Pistacia integerrima]